MGLFKPSWMSRDESVAWYAVKKVDDEVTLRRIVDEARCSSARYSAAKKLIDKGIDDDKYWRRLASSHRDRDVRILAVGEVEDMDFLGEFLRKPENLDKDGYPEHKLNKKWKEAVNKKKLEAAEKFMNEIDSMNDSVLLKKIAFLDEAVIEERYGKTDLGRFGRPPKVRERALTRLLTVDPDEAYRILTSSGAIDEDIAFHVIWAIKDDQLLYRIASDGNARKAARILAIGSASLCDKKSVNGIADIDLLGKLANLKREKDDYKNYSSQVFDIDEEVREAAARKLCDLPCRNGQVHKWECIDQKIDEVGNHYYGYRRYRCSICGNGYEEDVTERM